MPVALDFVAAAGTMVRFEYMAPAAADKAVHLLHLAR